MNCLIYARVSTERQADKELSIPAQLHACRQYAQQRGWTIVEEVLEPGASARTAERPGLRGVLSRCRQTDPRVSVVLVHKIDRLARNLADHVAIRGLLKSQGVAIASVVENFDDSNAGVLVEHIMASLAEFYSANLSEEVKKGMQQRVRKGGWPHLPPRGYVMTPTSGGYRVPTPDPVLAPLVRMAFQRAASGFPTLLTFRHELARLGLTGRYGGPLSNHALVHLLRNPFYAGRIVWKGQEYSGNHEPIVSTDLFDRVQSVLRTRRVRERTTKRHFLLRGVATCESCGSLMTGEVHGAHRYYRCLRSSASTNRCRSRFCVASRAETPIEELLRGTRVSGSIRRHLRRAIHAAVPGDDPPEFDVVATQLAAMERRAIALADAFAGGAIDIELYRLTAQKLQQERRALQSVATIRQVRSGSTLWDFLMEFASKQQVRLLSTVFESVVLCPEGISRMVLRSPFDRMGREAVA